jgi:hypothetical protein
MTCLWRKARSPMRRQQRMPPGRPLLIKLSASLLLLRHRLSHTDREVRYCYYCIRMMVIFCVPHATPPRTNTVTPTRKTFIYAHAHAHAHVHTHAHAGAGRGRRGACFNSLGPVPNATRAPHESNWDKQASAFPGRDLNWRGVSSHYRPPGSLSSLGYTRQYAYRSVRRCVSVTTQGSCALPALTGHFDYNRDPPRGRARGFHGSARGFSARSIDRHGHGRGRGLWVQEESRCASCTSLSPFSYYDASL